MTSTLTKQQTNRSTGTRQPHILATPYTACMPPHYVHRHPTGLASGAAPQPLHRTLNPIPTATHRCRRCRSRLLRSPPRPLLVPRPLSGLRVRAPCVRRHPKPRTSTRHAHTQANARASCAHNEEPAGVHARDAQCCVLLMSQSSPSSLVHSHDARRRNLRAHRQRFVADRAHHTDTRGAHPASRTLLPTV